MGWGGEARGNKTNSLRVWKWRFFFLSWISFCSTWTCCSFSLFGRGSIVLPRSADVRLNIHNTLDHSRIQTGAGISPTPKLWFVELRCAWIINTARNESAPILNFEDICKKITKNSSSFILYVHNFWFSRTSWFLNVFLMSQISLEVCD